MLLFGLAEEHLHTAALSRRPGYLARDLSRVLACASGREIKAPSIERIDSRAYAWNVLRYLLRQPTKHGISVPAAQWTGCGFQDLVGARLLAGFDPRAIEQAVGGFDPLDLYECVGLDRTVLEPADDRALRRAGIARLAELAAGVFCLPSGLDGRSRLHVRARRLAVAAVEAAGSSLEDLARELGVTPRTLRRLSRLPMNPGDLRALRLRHDLIRRSGTLAPGARRR